MIFLKSYGVKIEILMLLKVIKIYIFDKWFNSGRVNVNVVKRRRGFRVLEINVWELGKFIHVGRRIKTYYYLVPIK